MSNPLSLVLYLLVVLALLTGAVAGYSAETMEDATVTYDGANLTIGATDTEGVFMDAIRAQAPPHIGSEASANASAEVNETAAAELPVGTPSPELRGVEKELEQTLMYQLVYVADPAAGWFYNNRSWLPAEVVAVVLALLFTAPVWKVIIQALIDIAWVVGV